MSDRMWGTRFAQRGTKPAWHHIGLLVGNQSLNAVQMLDMIGSYRVELFPLLAQIKIEGHKETLAKTDYMQIWRFPTKDDPRFVPFGEPVSKDYELIGPMEGAQIWDRALIGDKTPPVETIGVLMEGRVLFISAKMDGFDVMGDPVEMYLVFYSPMYSNEAAIVCVTCVRPVCWNTLQLGFDKATSKMILPHTPGAKNKVQQWIRGMYLRGNTLGESAKEAFMLMASKHIKSKAATDILKKVYPDPPTPQRDWAFGISYEAHLAKFEEKMAKVEKTRDTVLGLFGGDGMGQMEKSCDGTVYGLYNAVSELEDNRITSNSDSLAISVTVGDRAGTIRSAFNHCLEYASTAK